MHFSQNCKQTIKKYKTNTNKETIWHQVQLALLLPLLLETPRLWRCSRLSRIRSWSCLCHCCEVTQRDKQWQRQIQRENCNKYTGQDTDKHRDKYTDQDTDKDTDKDTEKDTYILSLSMTPFRGERIIWYSNIIRILEAEYLYWYSYSGDFLNPNIIRIRIRVTFWNRILFVFVFGWFSQTE